MKKYVIHLYNPTSLDERVCVSGDARPLADVAHEAIAKIVSDRGGAFDLPMFIDIHPAESAPEFPPLSVAM